METSLIRLLCVILFFVNKLLNGAFIETPSSLVIGVEVIATFRCEHPDARFIGWKLNNFDLETGSFPNVTDNDISDQSSVLTILALPEYNETVIVCEALLRNGSLISSPSAILLVQGLLSMVSNIQRNSSTITWEPPFSLNLTGVDPDIVYCVEVYNITCGVDNLVVGDCNVTEPRYVDNRLQQGYIYRITIIPRSNRQNTQDMRNIQNGTQFTKEEMFIFLTNTKTSVNLAEESTTDFVIVILSNNDDNTIVDEIEPDSYSLYLSSIDGIEDPPNNTSVALNSTRNTTTIVLTVNQPLPRTRLWNYQVLALGCAENPVTDLLELSTHDLQNVTVSSSSFGEICITGNLISGSTANSILVIIYSMMVEFNVLYYKFSTQSGGIVMACVRGLPIGQYVVSVFVVEENGLPFERSATTPRSVSVSMTNGNRDRLPIEYEIEPTSTGVCITCTFENDTITDCVAVVHQQISQLSSSGLMNIELSHRFNRSGDTAYGCIEGVSLDQYQVGVVEGRRKIMQVPRVFRLHPGGIAAIIIIAVIMVCILVLVATIIVLCRSRKHKSLIYGNVQDKNIIYDRTVHYKVSDLIMRNQGEKEDLSLPGYATIQKSSDSSLPQKEDTGMYDEAEGIKYAIIGAMASPKGIPDDLHKTDREYSILPAQQESGEASTGQKSTDDVKRSDYNDSTTDQDPILGFDDSAVNHFKSVEDHVFPPELTTPIDVDDIVDVVDSSEDSTHLLTDVKVYQKDTSLKCANKHRNDRHLVLVVATQNSINGPWKDNVLIPPHSQLNQSSLPSGTVIIY